MSTLSTIVIPMRGSAVLELCVASFADNARKFGHSVRFIISEDGDANPRRAWWFKQLSREVPETAARFLLYGDPALTLPSIGANRNLLLLETAGKPFLTVDDDVICEWRRAPEYRPGIVRTPRYPGTIRLHASLEHARDAVSPEPFDVVTHFAESLRRAPVVQAGLAGDAATDTPFPRLLLGGPAREQWLAEPQLWRTRAMTQVPAQESLVAAPQMMTFCTAFDGSLLPFAPMGRNEDSLYAALRRMVEPDTVIAHLPWTVWHEPAPAREFASDAVSRGLSRLSLNDALLLLLRHRPPHTLKGAAGWLEDLGTWAPREFLRLLTELRVHSLCVQLDTISRALRAYGSSPGWWACELRAAQLILEQTLESDRLLEGCERIQEYAGSFGALLRHWPAIREIATAGTIPGGPSE